MPHNKIRQTKVFKIFDNKRQTHTDFVAVETPLEIRLGHEKSAFHSLAITMCSPENIQELVYGYLFTENIINQLKDVLSVEIFDNHVGLIVEIKLIKSIKYDKFLNQRNSRVYSSCGVCGKTSMDDLLSFKYPQNFATSKNISDEIIQSLPDKLKKHQKAFNQTGGIHASAIFTLKGDFITVKEDIGRHNALDKLIGSALLKNLLPFTECIILLSGRISFELIHKSLMSGATHLVAIGAPSSLSIEMAKLNHLNLYGFVNNSGYNQY